MGIRQKMLTRFFSISGLAGLLALSACTLQEGVNNPLTQRFAWFQYLNGADIREGCFEGGLWRVRLIYNGRYQEQVRLYNVVADGAGGGASGGARPGLRQPAGDRPQLGRRAGALALAPRGGPARRAIDRDIFQDLGRERFLRAGAGQPQPAVGRILLDRDQLHRRRGPLQRLALPIRALSGADLPGVPLCPRHAPAWRSTRPGRSTPPS